MHKFRILVPVSFGDPSDKALKLARVLAQQAHAMITCLHVMEKPGLMGGTLLSREVEQKIRRESEMRLASKVHDILSGDGSVSYELIVSTGKVYRKILEKASELDMDMIIMGRSDSRRGNTTCLGSNARRVIELSDIPVISLRNHLAQACGHLLVPLDLSASVTLQLAKTIELAEMLNARLTVCAILHSGGSMNEAAYKRRLIEIKKLLAQYDISCRVKLIITSRGVAEDLLSFSLRYQPDLLALMTQKEAEAAALSLGSVAHELLCKSEVPILSMAPVVRKDLYPYTSLFGSINHPIKHFDLNDRLIKTN